MRLGVSSLLPDLGFRCGSAFPTRGVGFFESGFRCGSAFGTRLEPVLEPRSWIWVRLGFSCLFPDLGFRFGSASPVCYLIVSSLFLDLGFKCGSVFPVCYLISVLGAARRRKGVFVGCAGSGCRCGSASPVCYLISVLGAARHFLCVT